MMRLALTVVLCAFAGSATSQDLHYDTAVTRGCLSTQGSLTGEIGCIGLAANACMENTPGGHSTVGMGGCFDRERAYWDGRLNPIYGRLVNRAKTTGTEAELRDMQRAWISYRDARCAHAASLWAGGTGAGPAFVACLMQTTGEQALYLRSLER